MANINLGAIVSDSHNNNSLEKKSFLHNSLLQQLLTGFVIVGGAMIGGISRLINGGSFIEIAGGLPWFRSGNKKQKSKKNPGNRKHLFFRIIHRTNFILVSKILTFKFCFR